MKPRVWTVAEVLGWSTGHLRERGYDSPRLDCELLLAHTTGMTRLQLYMHPDRPLSTSELAGFKAAMKERLQGMSVAHIVGWREFWRLRIKVPRTVFVPRPETELIVERILALTSPEKPATMVDLCTGTGAVAVSILKERPAMTAVAVDLSPEAVAATRENGSLAGILDRLTVHCADAADWLASRPGQFDFISCNPPYIPTAQLPSLPPEVGRFEPRLALDGGQDGLDLVRRIAPHLESALLPHGRFLVEFDGDHQTPELSRILRHGRLSVAEVLTDLAGHQRIAVAGVNATADA